MNALFLSELFLKCLLTSQIGRVIIPLYEIGISLCGILDIILIFFFNTFKEDN